MSGARPIVILVRMALSLGAFWPVAAHADTPRQECAPEVAEPPSPFSVEDNLVTGAAAVADGAAGVLMHSVPALVLLPALAVAVDNAFAERPVFALSLSSGIGLPVAPTLMALSAILACYALLAPAVDAAVILAVRGVHERRWPAFAHVLAMLTASYISFPVALAGAMGLVGFASILAEPNLPTSVPHADVAAAGIKVAVFAGAVEVVLAGIRPWALAMFERTELLARAAGPSGRP